MTRALDLRPYDSRPGGIPGVARPGEDDLSAAQGRAPMPEKYGAGEIGRPRRYRSETGSVQPTGTEYARPALLRRTRIDTQLFQHVNARGDG